MNARPLCLFVFVACASPRVEPPLPLRADAGSDPTRSFTPMTEATIYRTLYVAPSRAAESDCTSLEPCTLTRARDLSAGLSDGADGDIEVQLADGEYRLAEPLTFTAEASGKHGHRIIWRAADDARPILSGAIPVRDWTLADATMDIWRAELPAGVRSRQLYIDGQRAPIAQAAPPVALSGQTHGYTAADNTYASWRNPSQIEFVYRGGNGEWTESRCHVGSIQGARIDMAQPCWKNLTDRPHLAAPAFELPSMDVRTTPSWIENAYELMQPGQWYLDQSESALYYRSAGVDPQELSFELPVLERLLVGEGTLDNPVHDLTFQGLTFAYATWNDPSSSRGFVELQANIIVTGAIDEPSQGTCQFSDPRGTCPYGAYTRPPGNLSFHAARDIHLVRNRLLHLGAAGIVLEYGSRNNVIEGNEVSDVSGNGIVLGDTHDPHPQDVGESEREINAYNTVDNNTIRDIGAEFHGAVGIMLFFTQHSSVHHNVILDVPYSGISSGAVAGHVDIPDSPDNTSNINADNEISRNVVFHFMTVLRDGGAIYVEGHQGETVRDAQGNVDRDTSFAHGLLAAGNVVYDGQAAVNAYYDDIGSQWIRWQQPVQWLGPGANGGCLPVGHIQFVDGYHSGIVSNFACGEPVDMQYEGNTQIADEPLSTDLPLDVLSKAGLEPDYRDVGSGEPPRLGYVKPDRGMAQSDTDVMIAGAYFTADAQITWDDRSALGVNRLNANFLIATAPKGADLSRLQITTAAGSVAIPRSH